MPSLDLRRRHELLDREELRAATLAATLALLASTPTDPALVGRLASCLLACDGCVTELLAAAEARSVVERRFLAGHPALFPDEAVRFAEQVTATTRQAALAMRLAELEGVPAGEPGSPDAVPARAAALTDDLVEPARVTALEKLGDGRRAFSIATRWLRGKGEALAG